MFIRKNLTTLAKLIFFLNTAFINLKKFIVDVEWEGSMSIHGIRSAVSLMLLLFLAGCLSGSGGGVEHLSWTKTTSSGKPVLLSDHYQVDPNCTFLAPPPVQIVSGPAHGATKIEQAKVYPSFKPDNVRYKCNSVLGNGIRVYYTSSPDFKGDDQVVVRSDFGGGEMNEITVRITVK